MMQLLISTGGGNVHLRSAFNGASAMHAAAAANQVDSLEWHVAMFLAPVRSYAVSQCRKCRCQDHSCFFLEPDHILRKRPLHALRYRERVVRCSLRLLKDEEPSAIV
jgi:hypothetical protein